MDILIFNKTLWHWLKRPANTTIILIALLNCIPGNASADDFNKAVNLYLQGFEYCQIAKNALLSNDIKAANKALNDYLRIKKQATAIDSSILTSKKRGMDSNIKSCERVASDIQIQAGTPLLNMALNLCERAKQAVDQGRTTQAQVLFNEYSNLKNDAFTASPGLNNKFKVRNQVTLCDRVQNKIYRAKKKNKSLLASASSAIEQSIIYLDNCQNSLDTLQANPTSSEQVIQAQQKIKLSEQIKQNALEDAHSFQKLPPSEKEEKHSEFVKNLSAGDRCTQKLKSQITQSQNQMASIEKQLKQYHQPLNKAINQCQSVQKRKETSQIPKLQKTLSAARGTYQHALSSLQNDRIYQQHKNWNESRRIQSNLNNLKLCLAKSKKHLLSLKQNILPTIDAPDTGLITTDNDINPEMDLAITSEPPNSSRLSITAPEKITGTISLSEASAEFALFYMLDGAEPSGHTEIVINDAGFNQFLYVHSTSNMIKIKSRDNQPHRLSTKLNANIKKQKLLYLQPRQYHRTTVDWPEHSITILQSNRPNIDPAYIANIPTINYQMLQLDKQSDSIQFEMENPNAAETGYVLLPGMDPVRIQVAKGETRELPITKNTELKGKIILKGL